MRTKRGLSKIALRGALLAACLLPVSLAAQEPPIEYGVHGGIGFNTHTGSFNGFSGTARCGTFTSGSGTGWYAGAHAEIPFGSIFSFLPRLTLSALNGSFTAPDGFVALLPPDYSTLTPIATEHALDVRIAQVAVEALVGLHPFAVPFRLMGGIEAGYIFEKTYAQDETVVSPPGIDFGTNKNVSGNLPASAFRAALLVGAAYRFPVGGQWSISPEISYSAPLTPVGSGLDWRIAVLRAGVSVDFHPVPPAEPVPEPPKIEPPPPPPPLLAASLRARSIAPDGTEEEIVRINVEETQTTDMFPLLPYVFFRDGAAAVPSSMASLKPADTASFDPGRLPRESLALYRHMLDIVGMRMKRVPEATLTLTGFAGRSAGEQAQSRLPVERAEAVRAYLSTVWGVSPARMRLANDTAAFIPGSPEAQQLEEEARRVIISSSRYEILAPIVIDDIERTVTPPRVLFLPDVSTQTGLAHWDIAARQGSRTMKEFHGEELRSAGVEWDLTQGPLPAGEEPIVAALEVRDRAGQRRQADVSIPVRQLTVSKKKEERIGNLRIARYRLILFGYNSAALGPVNERIMAFIKDRLSPDARVRIDGYTDHVGQEERNMLLSSERAKSARSALGDALPDDRIEIRANGESDLFDNALPEGRYYCRTVHVTVETPAR